MIKQEMDTVCRLDHPNIVKLLDWFESRDKYYMVFTLYQIRAADALGLPAASSLTALWSKASSPKRTVWSTSARFSVLSSTFTAKELCIAVIFAVLWLDLKPENLLFRDQSPESPLMIADFG
jgi:calcium/calmodulin-dependent protein kinase I